MTQANLTAANIKYLLTLNELDGPNSRGIRCVDVAKKLEITKPSVHTMIKNLRDMGLVIKEHYGTVYMTREGKRAADRYSEYYCALKKSMINSVDLTENDCRDLVCKVLAKTSIGDLSRFESKHLYGSD